eukprot:Nitzschia sp. Nitz4//scaffold143_size57137//39997//42090//NITZ4_006518-RA/size57137-processed-gene-0.39-mRNA-1//1//CDS//3329536458//4801//frame0
MDIHEPVVETKEMAEEPTMQESHPKEGETEETPVAEATPIQNRSLVIDTTAAESPKEGTPMILSPIVGYPKAGESTTAETAPETKTPESVADSGEDFFERDFDKNPTVLFALLQKKKWEAAIERTQAFPDEGRAWVSRKEKDGKLRWRLLPIHAAIVFQAPVEVIEALLAAFPEGAHTKDDQGMLPLHLAFRNGSAENVVNALLVAYPQSIEVKDRKGRIPLVLAQASTSPNKEAFLRALERGPTYYAVAAAAAERAAITAEQQAVFETKLMQAKQTHRHELATLQSESEAKQAEMAAKIAELESELAKEKETCQVLVDHVNNLDAQLNTRSDTERFLATKIATLDCSLKTSTKGRDEVEAKLKTENVALLAERDGYKSKYAELETKYEHSQLKLTEATNLLEQREKEWNKTEEELQHQIKNTRVDWANAQANCAILDAQLKKKIESEHGLASQISTLAGQLADAACESRDNTHRYSKEIKELQDERLVLRESVQDLTKRLKMVAGVLQDMTLEQRKVLEECKVNDNAIAEALKTHSHIVEEALEQQRVIEEAKQEREELKRLLALQEEHAIANDERRSTIMSAIEVQGEHMEKTKAAREVVLKSVENLGAEFKVVLDSIFSVLPTDAAGKEGDGLIDAVVHKITSPIFPGEEEMTKVVDVSPTMIQEEKKEEEPEQVEQTPPGDRILAAREELVIG